MVVQWKLPEKFSSFVQRAGRAARGAGRSGVAVLLAEPSAFSVDTSFEDGEGGPPDVPAKSHAGGGGNGKKAAPGRRGKAAKGKKSRLPKEYGELHGRYRGERGGARDEVPQSLTNSVHIQDCTEGMHAFVQTPSCRRAIQRDVFANPPSGK